MIVRRWVLRRNLRENWLPERKIIRIDAGSIGYVQYPEHFTLQKRRDKYRTAIVDGTWDEEIPTKKLFFSAKYEAPRHDENGMIALSRYQFFLALQDRFDRGLKWEETDWFQWLMAVRPRRYKKPDQVSERLRLLEQLYEDAQSGKFVIRGDLPRINIGRGNRIAIDDGRHRLCIAKLVGLPEIEVSIGSIHPDVAASYSL